MLASHDIHPVALQSLLESANHAAARFCRRHAGPRVEQDDVRQDLLLDLLVRLNDFDPDRSSLPFFAAICFRHRTARLSVVLRGDHGLRHPAALDAPLPGDNAITLLDTLAEADGYAAWIGQPVDQFDGLDRRLDLDRALSTLPSHALPVCAALMRDEPDPASSAGVPRTTFYRRVQDLRCRLMAAGVDGARGTARQVAG